ncbi:DUF2087 domain-containing protein [Halovivax gelatinilyticus]|uniref:DUF2087 domain-containing protein n=1 Tax=Halovivax gelatinilyticus TaxID=2961597 RepID=UPI0020CA69B8|nr:DUF2087 domain-containing protein [Halovivax gelatinilyticus]
MDLQYDRDADEYAAACLERGRLPRNDALKQIVLARVIDRFDVGETYEKSAVNDVLSVDFDDHVLVRRELLNFGYVSYDNTENTYTVVKTELSESDYRNNTRLERHAKDLGLLE